MDIRQIRYFSVLAQELNFTRAAALCNVSQPPLSRSIRMLEEEMGVELFIRDTHHVRLTPAGKSLAIDVKRIISMLEESSDRAKKIAKGMQGTITLGFGGSPVYSILPELIRGFSETFPDIEIVFRAFSVLEQIEALRQEQIDVGIVRLPIVDELLKTEEIHQESLIVALPEPHPLLDKPGPISIFALANQPFVAYEARRGFNYHVDLNALCRFAGFEPRIIYQAPSNESVVGIVACGKGVALVPESVNRLSIRGVAFRPIDKDELPRQLVNVSFGICWRRENASPVVSKIVEYFKDI